MNALPRTVAVVGAGMLGLCTAWFLQERGAQVTVIDEAGPGAGASWGNAGWITPTLSTPLPEPSLLAHGIRQLPKPSSPLYVPAGAITDPGLLGFLARFARNSTPGRWRAGMEKLAGINRQAVEAFDALAAGGVIGPIHEADPFIIGYADPAEAHGMLDGARRISGTGQDVEIERLTVDEARATARTLSANVRAALLLRGQRYLHPPAFLATLADSVVARGGSLRAGIAVTAVRDRGRRVGVLGEGLDEDYDAVVLANGAMLNTLAAAFGVRARVRAGRGYSFSVAAEHPPPGPLYFPACSVVCTPLGERMRVAGMMEFRPHRAPLDRRRITAIARAVHPFLQGVDLDDRRDEWVGSRPCTADGLPLVGRTASPRVFVAGGHGMEGMTLGPATGRLLAEAIRTGTTPRAIAGFDPLR